MCSNQYDDVIPDRFSAYIYRVSNSQSHMLHNKFKMIENLPTSVTKFLAIIQNPCVVGRPVLGIRLMRARATFNSKKLIF